MKKIFIIARREFFAAFFSPIAYIVITVFLIVSGYLFAIYITTIEVASMRVSLSNIGFILLFLTPLITMRLLSEEIRSGTIEVLLTDPIKDGVIVLGKYLAACMFLTAMLAPTILYSLILENLGEPDWGPIYSGYLGLLLMGYLMISIGLFFSALTRNQIVAAVLTFVFLLLLWILHWAVGVVDPSMAKILSFLSLFDHFDGFRRGVVDSRDVMFYVSTIGLFLFITTRMVEAARWR